MCGACEPKMAKAGMCLGMLSTAVAVVTKLAGMAPMHVGPRAFAAAAALGFLMAIAANTTHSHPSA